MRAFSRVLTGGLTLLMALALVGPREFADGRGRDSVIRMTRGAPRLDTVDATSHAGDDAEIVAGVPSGLVAPIAAGLPAPESPDAVLPAAIPVSPGSETSLTLDPGAERSACLSRPGSPARGRAPPAA